MQCVCRLSLALVRRQCCLAVRRSLLCVAVGRAFPRLLHAVYPLADALVCAAVLGVLRLCEGHFVHGVAVLVGEYYYEIRAGEMRCQLLGQIFYRVLV